MVDFLEHMRLRGKAEEDLYFAERDRQLIKALHEKHAREQQQPDEPVGKQDFTGTPEN
ncbi:hypothetical protein [Photobacterium atrarenae]|uniref:Uncharacterized protein n=1 Tax=Photobacterium atrarenae TaxID=865757 RepID=A0ABY5GC35_9GAMM|nr:hypothetical protein [Photobacterium atrarenae]UTV26768.1 hypothetical protein NNL38_10410 [Photobacterium atrarenae]